MDPDGTDTLSKPVQRQRVLPPPGWRLAWHSPLRPKADARSKWCTAAVSQPARRGGAMKPGLGVLCVALACGLLAACAAVGSGPQPTTPVPATPYKFKAAAEHATFEWFFLLVEAGKDQGIWTKHGLVTEFVPAA